jgi:signal peptidase I
VSLEHTADPTLPATPPVESAAEPEPESEPQPRGTIAEWTITVLLLLFLTTTLVQAFVIPTGSMEDTLLIGDHLLVDKLAYAPSGPISKYILPYSPVKRGDIIVFRYPLDIRQTYVKRAIGVPGDHIRIVNKEVYLNGTRLNEVDCEKMPDPERKGKLCKYHKSDYIDSYRDNFPSEAYPGLRPSAIQMLEHHVVNGELVVPANCYFAMGDNRDSSDDSRFWGFVPRENIIGKPLIVYWSYDAPSDRLQNPSIGWDHALDLVQHFFTKTRWKRTFMLIHGEKLP